jgi:hypothetical protein
MSRDVVASARKVNVEGGDIVVTPAPVARGDELTSVVLYLDGEHLHLLPDYDAGAGEIGIFVEGVHEAP